MHGHAAAASTRQLLLQGMEERAFFSRPVLSEFPDGTPQTLLDAVFAICPEAVAPPVACRLHTAAAGDGAAVVRMECSVQLLVEQVGSCPVAGQPVEGRAVGAAEQPQVAAGQGAAAGGMPPLPEVGAGVPATDAAELAASSAGDANAVEGGVRGDAAISGSAMGVDADGGAAGGVGDGADGAPQEEVGEGGVADAGADEQSASCGGEGSGGEGSGDGAPRAPAEPAMQGGTVSGVGVARAQGRAGERGAGRHREQYTRVVRGYLREGVSVYVGGVRAHAQEEVLWASVRLLHDVLFAPDLFLYVVIQFARGVGGGP